jgi:hypothetical protein
MVSRGHRFTHRGSPTRLLATTVAALALAGLGVAAPAAAGGHGHRANCPPSTYPAPYGADVAYADLDGDGSPQPVALGTRVTGSGGVAWDLVGLVGADQQPVGVELTPLDKTAPMRIYDVADVDGDGDEDVVIAERGGASSEWVQVWGMRDCRWTQMTLAPDNAPISFLLQGGVTDTSGLRCVYETGGRKMMHNWRASRIRDTERHELTFGTFTMTDLHLTGVGQDVTIVVTDEQLARDWLPPFSCYAPMSDAPPAAPVETTTTTTKPAAAAPVPVPVKAKPSYTG